MLSDTLGWCVIVLVSVILTVLIMAGFIWLNKTQLGRQKMMTSSCQNYFNLLNMWLTLLSQRCKTNLQAILLTCSHYLLFL